jgi:hypothetical protein
MSQTDLESLNKKVSDERGTWEIVEMILSTVNQMFIGITTFYYTWLCIQSDFNSLWTWHVFLSVLGVSRAI